MFIEFNSNLEEHSALPNVFHINIDYIPSEDVNLGPERHLDASEKIISPMAVARLTQFAVVTMHILSGIMVVLAKREFCGGVFLEVQLGK